MPAPLGHSSVSALPASGTHPHDRSVRRGFTLATIASSDLLISLCMQLYVVTVVGVGSSTDAYFAGQVIPVSIYGILQLPLQRAIIAAFAGRDAAVFPAARLWLMFTVLAACLLGALAALAPFYLRYVFPSLAAGEFRTTTHIFWLQSAAVVLMTGNLILSSLNQVVGRFVQCELVNVTSTVASACVVLATVGELGVVALALGAVFKAALSALAYRAMLRGRIGSGKSPWSEVWSIVRPMVAAGSLSKFAPVVDRSIASAAAAGSLTLLTLAQTIYSAATVLVERAVVAPLLPGLRRQGNSRATVATAGWLALCAVVVVAVVVVGVALAAHSTMIHRWLSAEQLRMLVGCLLALGGFSVGGLSGQWLSAALVVLGRADLSSRVAIYGFLLSVPMKLAAFSLWGIYGLALAISCYYLLNALIMAVLLASIRTTSDSVRAF